MVTPHPTRLVRFYLLAILLGVSITFAVEDLIHGYSTSMLIAVIAFLLTSLNFFHGKVVTLEDEDYNNALIDRPALALADYVLNLLIILCFVFMPFFLDKPGRLIATNLVLRTLDVILVLSVRSVSPRESLRRAQDTWLWIDAGVIVYFLVFLWLYWPAFEHHLATSIAFLLITLTDILLDYSINRKMYFSMADSWDDMAMFWDALQGENGDINRRAIIIPAILEAAKPCSGMRVLEAGCGNGCIARALVKSGAQVYAIDSSARHLEIAKSYATDGISYQLANLDVEDGVVEGGPFDVVVFCFTLQDCQTIETPLRQIAGKLKPEGRVIVIFENANAFQNIDGHSTTRRWISSARLTGNGRRQLIHWEPRSIPILRGASGAEVHDLELEWSQGFKTVTRHWSASRYIEEAQNVGLRLVSHIESLPLRQSSQPKDRESRYLACYRLKPRFGMLVFQTDSQAALSSNEKPL